jgi:hypothetical protein
MLNENTKNKCKGSDLHLWFPNIATKYKAKLVSDNLKETFDISHKEAPINDPKKEIVIQLEHFLNPFIETCRLCGQPNGHSHYCKK